MYQDIGPSSRKSSPALNTSSPETRLTKSTNAQISPQVDGKGKARLTKIGRESPEGGKAGVAISDNDEGEDQVESEEEIEVDRGVASKTRVPALYSGLC
jgi:hypothetical protein